MRISWANKGLNTTNMHGATTKSKEEIVIVSSESRRSVTDIFVFWDVTQRRVLLETDIWSLSVRSSSVKQSEKFWFFYFVKFYSSLNFLTIPGKTAIIEFNENPSSGSRFVALGQTYGHDETNSHFSQFCEGAEQNVSQ